jgi:hypothetical protein
VVGPAGRPSCFSRALDAVLGATSRTIAGHLASQCTYCNASPVEGINVVALQSCSVLRRIGGQLWDLFRDRLVEGYIAGCDEVGVDSQ